MPQLPTQEELEQLYYEKGRDALVWYAWRNALRASANLGDYPYKSQDGDKEQFIFVACRVYLILAQWISNREAAESAILDNSRGLSDAYMTTGNLTSEAYDYGSPEDANLIGSFTATISAIEFAARVAVIEWQHGNNELPVRTGTDIAKSAYNSGLLARRVARSNKAVSTAADSDYALLIEQKTFDQSFWFSQPLWTESSISENSEAISGGQHFQRFLSEIEACGLGFLAEDLSRLWEMKPLGDHAKSYLVEIPSEITNDPLALRKTILGK